MLLFVFIIPAVWCMNSVLITSVKVGVDVYQIHCSPLSIDGQIYPATCISNGNIFYNLYNATVEINKNITLLLEINLGNKNFSANYSGVFIPNGNVGNVQQIQNVTLNRDPSKATSIRRTTNMLEEKDDKNTTTAKPSPPDSKEASVTIRYIHLHYDDTPQKVVEKNNGAVAVAIIEGIALIAILAFMGYRTMVSHKRNKNPMNASMHGLENAPRITIPDSIRMSDIPPPRNSSYEPSPVPTLQQRVPVRTTAMTTQELVVPSSSSANAPKPTSNSNAQFSDPFDSLDNW